MLILNDNLVMNHLVLLYHLMIKIFDYHMVKKNFHLNDDKYDDDDDEDEFEY